MCQKYPAYNPMGLPNFLTPTTCSDCNKIRCVYGERLGKARPPGAAWWLRDIQGCLPMLDLQ